MIGHSISTSNVKDTVLKASELFSLTKMSRNILHSDIDQVSIAFRYETNTFHMLKLFPPNFVHFLTNSNPLFSFALALYFGYAQLAAS